MLDVLCLKCTPPQLLFVIFGVHGPCLAGSSESRRVSARMPTHTRIVMLEWSVQHIWGFVLFCPTREGSGIRSEQGAAYKQDGACVALLRFRHQALARRGLTNLAGVVLEVNISRVFNSTRTHGAWPWGVAFMFLCAWLGSERSNRLRNTRIASSPDKTFSLQKNDSTK